MVVQEEHEEAEQAELCRYKERAADADQPHARVAQRTRERGLVVGRLDTDEHEGDDRADQRRAREPEESRAQADALLEQRQRNRPDCAAERNGHLANPEREAALLLTEPRHHRASGRRVHAGGHSSGDRERNDEDAE